MLGPLFVLVYINDLVDDLSTDAKLAADDTSLFTIVYDENIAAEQLNNDLKIISEWAYQWKMQFSCSTYYSMAIQILRQLLTVQGWISDMGINGPTFVPKSGYFY